MQSLQGPGKELEFCSDCSRVLLKDVKAREGHYLIYMLFKSTLVAV